MRVCVNRPDISLNSGNDMLELRGQGEAMAVQYDEKWEKRACPYEDMRCTPEALYCMDRSWICGLHARFTLCHHHPPLCRRVLPSHTQHA